MHPPVCERKRRRGVTLIELVVTIAIIGIAAGVAVLAAAAPQPPPPNDLLSQIARARYEAIAQARMVSITAVIDGRAIDATAHPDGSVVVDSSVVERLSGRPPYVPR